MPVCWINDTQVPMVGVGTPIPTPQCNPPNRGLIKGLSMGFMVVNNPFNKAFISSGGGLAIGRLPLSSRQKLQLKFVGKLQVLVPGFSQHRTPVFDIGKILLEVWHIFPWKKNSMILICYDMLKFFQDKLITHFLLVRNSSSLVNKQASRTRLRSMPLQGITGTVNFHFPMASNNRLMEENRLTSWGS